MLVGKHVLKHRVQSEIRVCVKSPIVLIKMTKSHIYAFSVSKGCIEGTRVWEKQVLDVRQAFDLEFLWLFFYDLPKKRETRSQI